MRYVATLLSVVLLASPAWSIQIVTGTYTGDGTDNRDITISPACQPKVVMTGRAPRSASSFLLRTDAMSGDVSHVMSSAVALQADQIQALNSDGFQVGTTRNSDTVPYAYAAICDNSNNDFATGTYTGDGTDNRAISFTPSFTPEFVYIVPSASAASAWRGETSHASADDASLFNSPTASAANYIQSFGSGSFTVGTAMNAGATDYYYLAIKGNATAMATGSFTGDGSDSRDITVGFQPVIVFLKGDSTTEEGALRLASHSGDDSFCDTGAGATNIIQSFGATTFQVGTDTCANENTVTMFWAAIAAASPSDSFGPLRRRNQ